MTELNPDSIDRRPIQSRNARWAQAVSRYLAKLDVSPNAISLFGTLAAVVAGISFQLTSVSADVAQRVFWFIGGVLCQVRLLCNLFDGMVAVERNIASARGELYNEVPDRVSDAAVMIGLGYAAGGDVTTGYLAALVSVFVAYVRAVAKSVGAPNDFCGPMAKPQRMALVTAVAVYLTFSPVAWRLHWGEARIALLIVTTGGILTALRRLVRAVRHLEGGAR
ncbi:MAG: CDP-alcohol phosphatidyltransferase family protein [Planctomycetota bacterium]